MGKKRIRDKIKNPFLEKKCTLRSRLEFLDVDHINGIYDDEGFTLIRKFTDEEKKWYNQFIGEYLNCSFHKLNTFTSVDIAKNKLSKKELKTLKKEFLNEDKTINYDLVYNDKYLNKIARSYKIPSQIIKNLMIRKDICDQNNRRNSDFYSNSIRSNCHNQMENDDLFFIEKTNGCYEDDLIDFLDNKLHLN
jgi:hypothetical protein